MVLNDDSYITVVFLVENGMPRRGIDQPFTDCAAAALYLQLGSDPGAGEWGCLLWQA